MNFRATARRRARRSSRPARSKSWRRATSYIPQCRAPAATEPRTAGMVAIRPYHGSRFLLGVTGGIASYKAAWLARLLTKAGAAVDVVMTPAATELVGA